MGTKDLQTYLKNLTGSAAATDVQAQEDFRTLADILEQYGHGECHELTRALLCTRPFKAIALVGEKSGVPVHSCVLLGETHTLDAYGINTIVITMERYGALARNYIGEGVRITEIDEDWLDTFSIQLFSPEEILAEFKPVLDHLSIDLNAQPLEA